MPDAPAPGSPPLRPATEEEIADSLAFGLRYDGRKRVHHADTVMARITADRLVRHLQASGFVLMKRPTAAAPTTSGHRHAHRHAEEIDGAGSGAGGDDCVDP